MGWWWRRRPPCGPGGAAAWRAGRLASKGSARSAAGGPERSWAGAVIGYRSAPEASPETVLANVDRTIGELTSEALNHPGGPLAGACERAAAFLRGWWGEPPAPPFAGRD